MYARAVFIRRDANDWRPAALSALPHGSARIGAGPVPSDDFNAGMIGKPS